MSVSDIIQIISIICTSVLSIIAIIISVLTLVQNSKMIFESNKPYISIYPKVLNFISPNPYLILKNFGKSGAIILNVEYDENLGSHLKSKPFDNIQNTFIAPNETLVYSLDFEKEDFDKLFNFKITYQYLNKIYSETHIVTFKQFKDICYTKHHSSKDNKEISDVLQELIIQNI